MSATLRVNGGTHTVDVDSATPLLYVLRNDMCPAIRADGSTIYWFASRPNDSLGSTDIYWTNKSNILR